MRNQMLLACMLIASSTFSSVLAQEVTRVRDVENPAQHPFTEEGGGSTLQGFFGTGHVSDVPAGKRVVIEFVTAVCITDTTDTISLLRLSAVTGVRRSSYSIPVFKQGDPDPRFFEQRWVGAQVVRIYAERSLQTL